jgi:plastocyanin
VRVERNRAARDEVLLVACSGIWLTKGRSDDGPVRSHTPITVSVTVPAAGPYEFHCRYHPQAMRGTITVS